MTMNIYSYFNKLRKRYENIFLAETDEDICYSVEKEASRLTNEGQALREKLETVTLCRLGKINLDDGSIDQSDRKELTIIVNPVRPIDGIEKTKIENK